jgi:hypothetical protein
MKKESFLMLLLTRQHHNQDPFKVVLLKSDALVALGRRRRPHNSQDPAKELLLRNVSMACHRRSRRLQQSQGPARDLVVALLSRRRRRRKRKKRWRRRKRRGSRHLVSQKSWPGMYRTVSMHSTTHISI